MQTASRAFPCVVENSPNTGPVKGRRVAALAMAAAMAAPVPFVSVSVVRADDLMPGVVTVALADAVPATPAAALTNAQSLYKAGKYEESLSALQAIKPDGLDDAGKKALADATSQAQQATQMRRAARADFEMGQKAIETGDSATAANSFKNVVNNPYADEGTLAKAKEQSVLVMAGGKGAETDWKAMYDSAVADFKAGNYDAAKPKFVALQQNGYKAPWFAKAPREYLEQIDKNAAGPGSEEQARAAYLTGRDQYRKGDWIAARQNFAKAQSMGYKAGFFEDEPAKYLARMDKKEQADASTAARATMAGGPAVVVASNDAPLTERPAAVAPATPAGKPQPESVSTPDATPSSNPSMGGPAAVVAATGPTGEPVPMTDADRLNANVKQIEAEKNNKQFQARDLVTSAKAAEDGQRFAEARDLYAQASQLDPSNADAVSGRNRMLIVTGTSPVQQDPGDVAGARILAQRQSITFSINTALSRAKEQTAAKQFEPAQASIEEAAAGSRSNPSIFKPEENASFAQQIADARRSLAGAVDADRTQREADARAAAAQDAEQQRIAQAQQRTNTVKQLISDSQRLTQQGRYDEALKVITQIQTIDPQNEYAISVKPIIFDRSQLQTQRVNRENFENQFVQQMNDATAKMIPYSDILTYPPDWPDLSSRRDQTLRDERQVSPTDEAVNQLLEKTLPEVRFDNVSFSDVIDFLRDTSQANIFVNWKALEAAGINRDAPVSTRLRNVKLSKVLKTILESVGGGATVQLSYTVDEGVITISTIEDLAKNVETRTYDIRDLIIQIPDYENVPNFQLQSSSGSRTASASGGGGGGGGGSSSGSSVFGGGGGSSGSSNNQNQATKEELVEQITGLIKDTIGQGSWKEDGGSVGSLRELAGQLIVTQTPEVHRQINGLLQKLREQRSIQVMVEARFLTVQKNFLEDVGIDFDFYFNFDGNPFSNVTPGGSIGSTLTGFGNGAAVAGGAPSGVGGNVRGGATAQTIDPITGAIIPASAGNVRTGVAPIGVIQNSAQFTNAGVLNTGVTGNLASAFATTPNLSTQINAFLDDFQASLFFRATQGNQNVTQLTAPRLTLFNGQTANIFVATQTAYVSDLTPVVGTSAVGFDTTVDTLNSGVALSVTATVSADRKYVTLNLEPQLSTVIGIATFPVFSSATTNNGGTGTGTGTTTSTGTPTPVTNGSSYGFIQLPQIQLTRIQTSVSIPDGGTLLLGGTTITGEIEREAGVPVLSKIPFLKRAFTNRSFAKDESILLVLVKPTIIIQREIEQQNFPLLTSGAR